MIFENDSPGECISDAMIYLVHNPSELDKLDDVDIEILLEYSTTLTRVLQGQKDRLKRAE